jgi:hypothetical protein
MVLRRGAVAQRTIADLPDYRLGSRSAPLRETMPVGLNRIPVGQTGE